MKTKKNQYICFLFIIFFSPSILKGESIGSSTWNFSLKLPELWVLVDKNEPNDRYRFSHQLFNADLYIALYNNDEFKSAPEALSFVNMQFSDSAQETSFYWRHKEIGIGHFETNTLSGWTIACELYNQKGWIVLAGVSPIDESLQNEDLIISTLDSLVIDEGSLLSPGPMTHFAWNQTEPIYGKYRDLQTTIQVQFVKEDNLANQFVIDREFRLLTSYLNSEAIYDAWSRFYQLIYKDAWKRFENSTLAISSYLGDEPYNQAKILLNFVQEFEYERDLKGSDFLNLPEAFLEKKGDCDSRALLMVLILNQIGTDAILLISPEYKHALIGVDCSGEGARFESKGKKYLLMDTTAKVGPGLIPSTMADPSKWFAIHFEGI